MPDLPSDSPSSQAPLPQKIEPEAATRMTRRLTWFFVALTVLLVLRFILPDLAERMQYALVRGRQRAELEAAKTGLEQLPLSQISLAFELISKRVAPSVVHINVVSSLNTIRSSDPSGRFRAPRPELQGQGSGVIVDAAGYVITNQHVVANATGILVTLSDGRVVDGQVIGVDAETDLAVIKVEADRLEAAEWGDSDGLAVGAMVWAVGSPFGLQHSITFGILSAKNRAAMAGTAWQDFLQTDAAVNPGNSGGPLVDARGRIIGINSAIVGDTYQGISFAIPSHVARAVYEQLRAGGRVQRGWLGAQLGDVTEEAAREFNLPVKRGAYIDAVVTDRRHPSPAQQAGIRPGDIIVRWNGETIYDAATLMRWVAAAPIGTDADVTVIRDGRELTVTVHIGERPLQIN